MTVEALSSTADLEDAREQLLHSFAGLPVELLDEPNVVGARSIRQVMAHIAVWDSWAGDVLDALRRGETAELPDEATMIRLATARYAQTPFAEIRQAMRALRMPFLCEMATMTDAERSRAQYRLGDKIISADDLAEGFIEHDLEHASEIRAWRKARGD